MLLSIVCKMPFIHHSPMLFKVGSKKPKSIGRLGMNTWRRWKEMKTPDERSVGDSFSDSSKDSSDE